MCTMNSPNRAKPLSASRFSSREPAALPAIAVLPGSCPWCPDGGRRGSRGQSVAGCRPAPQPGEPVQVVEAAVLAYRGAGRALGLESVLRQHPCRDLVAIEDEGLDPLQ